MEKKMKKIPVRQCMGCNEHKPKRELVRVVKSPEGEISLDLTGRKSGRGAYICPSIECLAKAKKARRLEKAFSCQIPDDVYAAMEKEADLFLFGHTHRPLWDQRGKTIFFNPGSIGKGLSPTYGVIRIDGGRADARILPLH